MFVAMKRCSKCMRSGATGNGIAVSGRLGGAEIARTECYREGRFRSYPKSKY